MRAAISSLLADEDYIVTFLHTRRVGKKKEGEIKAIDLQCSCAPNEAASSAPYHHKRVRARRKIDCLF